MAPRIRKKTEHVQLMMKPEDKDLVMRAAEALGYPFSTWATVQLLTSARKVFGIPSPTTATNGGGA